MEQSGTTGCDLGRERVKLKGEHNWSLGLVLVSSCWTFTLLGVYIEVFGVLCFRLVWLLVLGACLAGSSSGPFAI